MARDTSFGGQLKWELSARLAAVVIVTYLASAMQSPISLLELRLHTRNSKAVLLCPEAFWRKGNVASRPNAIALGK